MTTRSGMVLVDKPAGLTSHDVVARLRRILGERRVGHAGTLDPMATGLLILAVGPATRLIRFAQGRDKTYTGTILFGEATDSLDADGAVVARAAVPELDVAAVNAAAATLTGPQRQVPPMVSAVHHGGERLYDLARRGEVVERAPRAITVDTLRLTPTEDPARWDFVVTCSVGTYVRVLASDLAERLGTLGHLVALRRTASGDQRVEDARTLEEIAEDPDGRLKAPSAFVSHLERVDLDADQIRQVRHGQRLSVAARELEVAAFDREGRLVAVLERRTEGYQPTLVFAEGA
jgi:tRNA pseudouridine55 synthase